MPNTTGTPISGREGRITINNTVLNLRKWQVQPEADDLPSTNFESIGTDGNTYEEGITSIRKATVSFEGFWDAAQNPHADPPNIRAGEYLQNVYLYVRKTGNRRFFFTELRCLSTPVNTEVSGLVQISANCKSNGQFTYPS